METQMFILWVLIGIITSAIIRFIVLGVSFNNKFKDIDNEIDAMPSDFSREILQKEVSLKAEAYELRSLQCRVREDEFLIEKLETRLKILEEKENK